MMAHIEILINMLEWNLTGFVTAFNNKIEIKNLIESTFYSARGLLLMTRKLKR